MQKSWLLVILCIGRAIWAPNYSLETRSFIVISTAIFIIISLLRMESDFSLWLGGLFFFNRGYGLVPLYQCCPYPFTEYCVITARRCFSENEFWSCKIRLPKAEKN